MWIQQDSCPDYMLKAEDCLRAEEERVNNYLHQSSKTKLLEQVRDGSDCLSCRVFSPCRSISTGRFALASESRWCRDIDVSL